MATKKEKLLEFYTQVLQSLYCDITEDSMVNSTHTTLPVELANGARLVLPTDKGLSLFSQGNFAAFHPLSENVILGQSDVIRKTRVLVNQAITHRVLITMFGLARAVAKKVDMTSTQVSKLSSVSGIDNKTVDALQKLMNGIDSESPQRLVNVFLKRGGSMDGNTYKRTAYVSFPLHDELVTASEANRDNIYGITMRKKDVQVIRKLFELLIPHADEENYYSFGSNSKAAPYFHALINAYANVLRELNGITWIFRKVLSETVGEEPHLTLDFIEDFGEGGQFRNVIPSLDGNQGSQVDGENTEFGEEVAEPQVQPQQPQQQPVQNNQQPQVQYQQPVQAQSQMVQSQQMMHPQYQQPFGMPVSTAPRVPDTVPTIGAKTAPAQRITPDGHAVNAKSDGRGSVIENVNDMYALAYPQALYPQPQVQAPIYPTFPSNQGSVQRQYAMPQQQMPQQQMQPMMAGRGFPQPQFNGYGAPQPYAQPMGYPTMQGFAVPQQNQTQSRYPKFPSAR